MKGKFAICIYIILILISLSPASECADRLSSKRSINVMLINAYTARHLGEEKWYHSSNFTPDTLPFITEGPVFFKESEPVNTRVSKFIYMVYAKYCQDIALEKQNIIGRMLKELEQNNMDVILPQYRKGWTNNDGSAHRVFEAVPTYTVSDMTLLEKNRYPLTLSIKRYEVFIDKDGKETAPFLGLGKYSYEGILKLRTEVIIEIANSKSNEIIDRIKLYKTYQSKPIRFDYSAIENDFVSGHSELAKALSELFDPYLKDLMTTISTYDYKTALSYAK